MKKIRLMLSIIFLINILIGSFTFANDEINTTVGVNVTKGNNSFLKNIEVSTGNQNSLPDIDTITTTEDTITIENISPNSRNVEESTGKNNLSQISINTINLENNIIIEDMANKLAEDLARKIVGENIAIKNVNFIGSNGSAGFFKENSPIVGFEEGIVLSTGSVHNVPGPNESNSISKSNGLKGDKDLDLLIPGYKTYDATILEFDFIPENDALTFKYVFGSEEYPEYVSSSYNDVFGLFVNGENVAIIPGSKTPVSINNLNDHTNDQYYRENHVGTNEINIELDGLTTVLTVAATVNPGQLNHIKLAIADAGDSAYDSNIFIEAASLNSLPITFEDPILENEIRKIINKPDGEITKADVYQIERLNLHSKGISSLEGIQHLYNLEELLLWDNNIQNIAPLSYLLNLHWLDIGENNIDDLSPLTNLTNLELLNASYNQIEDVTPINLLKQLIELDLSNNLIKFNSFSLFNANMGEENFSTMSISNPFSKLKKLKVLDLSNNQITDISNLSELTNIEELKLSENKIQDISALNQLTNLTALGIPYNEISNINSLSELTKLKYLDLSYNQIDDLSSLNNLINLSELALYNNNIYDLNPLSNLINLDTLFLSDNNIKLIQPLSSLNNLKILHLADNPVSDLQVLDKLTQLQELYTDDKYFSLRDWEEQIAVSAEKEWIIRVNHEIEPLSVNSKNIYVVNEDGIHVNVKLKLGDDNRSIHVIAPDGGYNSGKTYDLYITNQVKSVSGKNLKEPIKMKFSIELQEFASDLMKINTLSSISSINNYVNNSLQIKGWVQFFDSSLTLLEKNESENHFYNYIYQLPNNDTYKMLMNSLWKKYVFWASTSINDYYDDYGKVPHNEWTMREFIKQLRSNEKTIAEEYNIPDYSFETYLSDLNKLVESAIITVHVHPYMGEILSIDDYIKSWKEANEKSTLKSIQLDNELNKTGLFSSTYKMKKDTTTQLSLSAKYSILKKERSYWFDDRETKAMTVTKLYDSHWLSDNKEIATVYKGKVQARNKGNTVIKVRYFGKPEKIKIEVK